MTQHPDHAPDRSPDPGSDELAQVRDALVRRAAPSSAGDPGPLYASAQRRARARYRHQMSAGLLVAVALVGSVAGLVVLNHGRATVGVSVADPGGVSATTDTAAVPTTTAGSADNPYDVPCGDGFFSAAAAGELADHFGPRLDCTRLDSTWLVSFGGPAQGAIVAGLLPCAVGDQACLDPTAPHDFAAFRVLYLPPAPTTGRTITSFEFASSSSPGALDIEVDFGFPMLPPTEKPIPAVHIQKSSQEAVLKVTVGSACEPTNGPTVDRWIGPFALVSGSEALANPVPSWSKLPVLPTAC